MSKITRDDFDHILEVANEFEKLDTEMQKKIETMARLIAATQHTENGEAVTAGKKEGE